MQALPSLQLTLGPPLHPPPLHLSLLVHALPSLQLFELFENTHPFEALHESLVHPLPSAYFNVRSARSLLSHEAHRCYAWYSS